MDGLVQLGVKATCTMGTGCPPVEVIAEGLPSGTVQLSGSVSSQYLTALLMAAPLATGTGAWWAGAWWGWGWGYAAAARRRRCPPGPAEDSKHN